MRLAIVAVLAVGAAGLTIGGLAMTEAYTPPTYPQSILNSPPIETLEACDASADPPETLWGIVNNTPFKAEVTAEFHLNKTETRTYTLDSLLSGNYTEYGTYNVFGTLPSCQEEPRMRITDIEFLNVTSEQILIYYSYLAIMAQDSFEVQKLSNNPTAFWGTVFEYDYSEGIVGSPAANIEIIVVNVADHTDVKRTTTDENGKYFVFVEPGGYLIQAIGGGPDAYKYTTISYVDVKQVNLNYN